MNSYFGKEMIARDIVSIPRCVRSDHFKNQGSGQGREYPTIHLTSMAREREDHVK
jgi:hypothetical protein